MVKCNLGTVLLLVVVALSTVDGFGLWTAQQQLGQLINMKNQLFNHFLYGGPSTGNRGYSENKVYTVNENANSVQSPNRQVKKRDVVVRKAAIYMVRMLKSKTAIEKDELQLALAQIRP
jgi:regulatory protein YycH of two-component signal transduction system YycFG